MKQQEVNGKKISQEVAQEHEEMEINGKKQNRKIRGSKRFNL